MRHWRSSLRKRERVACPSSPLIACPSSPEVVSNTPKGNTCPAPLTYGLTASFDFQLKDSTGADVVTHNFPIVLWDYWEGYPGVELSEYGYTGIYEYTPVGACANFSFGPLTIGYDNLWAQIWTSYVYVGPVRSGQTWTAWGSSSGHGRVSNSDDVDVSE
jgi:hypothetical protein